MEMKWYTAFISPNNDKKVTSILNRKKITYFCPTDMIDNAESKKGSQSFSGYLFVKIAAVQLREISKIKGVKHLLYWIDKPATVTEAEINLIKSFLTEHAYVKLERRDTALNSSLYGDVTQKGNEGKLIHINDNKVKAALPSLRFVMIAEFEKSILQLTSNKTLIPHLKPKFKYRIAGNS